MLIQVIHGWSGPIWANQGQLGPMWNSEAKPIRVNWLNQLLSHPSLSLRFEEDPTTGFRDIAHNYHKIGNDCLPTFVVLIS